MLHKSPAFLRSSSADWIRLLHSGTVRENLYLHTSNNSIFYFTVPECSNRIQSADEDLKKAGDVCNINELFSCSENQVCVQLQPDNNMGQCQCLQGYDKQDDGVIISLFRQLHTIYDYRACNVTN